MSQTAKSISIGIGRQSAAESGRTRPRLLLAVMLLSVFMAVANLFIVNVATPAIQHGLQASFSDVQFVITGYTLAYAVALIIGGRLGDRFGRRKMLLLGVAGFTLASLFCGLSVSSGMLTIGRIVQGLCAALFSPQVLSLIQSNYAPEKRGAIFGMYGASQGIAASTGQIIGGLLLRMNPWDLDWRMVFFFSVPIGLIILCIAPFIPESKSSENSKLDWAGAALIAAGLLMLVYPLVQGQKEGWPLTLIASLILSFPVLAAFVWFERRVGRSRRVPFMNVELFRERAFSFGMMVVFLLMSSQGAFFLVSAYLLQIGLGFTALHAGLVILPMGMGYFLASLFSSKVVGKLGPHALTVGSVLTAAGYLLLAACVQLTGTSPDIWVWIPALMVLGVGQGLIAAPLTNIVLTKISKRDIGSASGVLTTGMQVASAIGISLIGIVWLNALGSHADRVSLEVEQQLRQRLASYSTVSAEQSEEVFKTFLACYPAIAGSGNPSSVPAECRMTASPAEAKQLYADSLRQANAQNYTDSFILCLFVLAVYTIFLVPLVLTLARKTVSRTEQAASAG